MSNFYTSEILLLPKVWAALPVDEQLVQLKNLSQSYVQQHAGLQDCQNIEFFNQALLNFSIDEVRRMQLEASYSAGLQGRAKRVFVLLKFDSASVPAQQATLKIIEESPAETLILLLCYQVEKILTTILSRCILVSKEALLTQLPPTKQLDSTFTTLLDAFNWPQNYSQAIQLAEKYKDREQALNLMTALLEKKELSRPIREALLKAYQDLNHNQNTQLVLENCFFSLVHLES